MELSREDNESVRRILTRLAEESVICAGRPLGAFYDSLSENLRESLLRGWRPSRPLPQADPQASVLPLRRRLR